MSNHSMQDFRVKRSVASSIKVSKIHWGSFLPTIITVLGVGAWIAGEAFYMGYWSAAGIPAITSMSLQQTAFAGFAAAYYNWAWLPLVIGLCALYLAILAVNFKSNGTLKIQWLIKLKNWWIENIEIDKKLGKLVSSLLIAAIVFSILILAPLTVGTSTSLAKRVDTGDQGRFRHFTRAEIANRSDSLDISWLKDDSVEDAADLPAPEVLAQEAMGELEAALAELQGIIDALGVEIEA